MTPAERIEKAFDDAHVVIAEYLQPGPRNSEETVNQLINILDNHELYEAVVWMLKAERPTVVPATRSDSPPLSSEDPAGSEMAYQGDGLGRER